MFAQVKNQIYGTFFISKYFVFDWYSVYSIKIASYCYEEIRLYSIGF